MIITQKTAEQKLCGLIESRRFRYQDWMEKRFACLKFASSTEKGDIGEDFLADLLRAIGYSEVEVVENRRGPYDVGVRNADNDIKFEVKVATQDIHNSFQFNGIRYDTQYTHLFCLGISRIAIKYLLVPKTHLLDNRYGHVLVSMQKGANATFKLTKRENQLTGFDEFGTEIAQLLGRPHK